MMYINIRNNYVISLRAHHMIGRRRLCLRAHHTVESYKKL